MNYRFRLALISICIGVITLLVLGISPTPSSANNAGRKGFGGLSPAITPLDYKPGEVLVEFREGTPPERENEVKSSFGEMTPLRTVGFEAGKCIQLIRLDAGVTVEQAVRELQSRPEVLCAEPNYIMKPCYTPSDTGFSNQWGLNNTGQTIGGSPGTPGADIDATRAWDIGMGYGSTVAVIDSGIDLSHPDLSLQLWINPGETPANGIDDDGNGYVDDYNGYNWSGISQYNFQWWDGNSWEYSYWPFGDSAGRQTFAQSFNARATAGHTQELSHVGILLAKTGNPTATITVAVKSSLSGGNLASFTINPGEVSTTTVREIYKPLSSTLSLTPGNTYYLVFSTSGINASDFYILFDNWGDATGTWDTYQEGQEHQWTGATWDSTSWASDDFYFRTNPYYYPHDLNGHGTHCSGIVGAAENGTGVVGVSFGSGIMALKAGDSSGSLSSSDIIDSIYYAADNGADVISMSFGGTFPSSLTEDAVNYAWGKGAILFSSSGNSGDSTMGYPAGYDNVIGIGATTNKDQRASFSTYNSSVDLSAPGKDIYSTMPTYTVGLNDLGYSQNYDFMSGTSMACPMAAGLAALVRSKNPPYTNSQVRQAMEDNADDLGSPGRDNSFGYGRINAYETLARGIISPPSITIFSPTSGPPGTVVTIDGAHFGATRSSSYVMFNNTIATDYISWSDARIKVKVPSGATTGPLKVTTEAGTATDIQFTVTTPAGPTWYLAEGTSDWGFDTYITIENPQNEQLTTAVTYMTSDGLVPRADVTLPPLSQTTINPRNDLGSKDFSTKVECREGKTIAVDRRMIWTGAGAASPDGHCSIGVTSAAKTWYLAEGSSDWGFECWLLIQNPNDSDAECTVTYMIEGEGPAVFTKSVPANSRASFNMANDIGARDASIRVEASVPVIPERAMYRNNRREGHDSIGTTTPASDFYLAEGTTNWGFTTYVLVQNPNDEPADVTVTYLTPSGPQEQPAFRMDPNSRKTICVNDVLPGKDLSTHVHGSVPIIAERAMYWGADTPLGEACHDSIGMSSPHTTFYLPDGETYGDHETWTLVMNPNDSVVTVDINYLTSNGSDNITFTDTVPANSRNTYNMTNHLPNNRAAVMVTCKTSGKKIMVERAMYWNNRGAGTDTVGGYGD